MEALRDDVGVGVQVARRIAQQKRGERRVVIDDDAALTVEDLAAGGEDGDVADSIFLGQLRINRSSPQTPQPVGEIMKMIGMMYCEVERIDDTFRHQT
jgi:hypothetical protein